MKLARGFTVIELTLVLALISVVMGIVIVRLDFGSTRQRMIQESRKIGNVIGTYRERAMGEQRVYALNLDANAGQWTVSAPQEMNSGALEAAPPLVTGTCQAPLKILSIKKNAAELASPVSIFLDPRGTAPELSIDVGIENGKYISILIDPLVNEVTYVEH